MRPKLLITVKWIPPKHEQCIISPFVHEANAIKMLFNLVGIEFRADASGFVGVRMPWLSP